MTILLNVLLINAIVVVPLAAAAWLASRLLRRPALTHVLWVLILIKLVTPPFFRLPFSISIPVATESVSTPPQIAAPVANSVAVSESPVPEMAAIPSCDNGQQSVPDPTTAITATPLNCPSSKTGRWYQGMAGLVPQLADWLTKPTVLRFALVAWVLGSVYWLAHQSLYALRFWRGIRNGSSIDRTLQQQVQQLSERIGLRRCPQVLIVGAQLSPMLWGYGSRLRLLFPADLASRLSPDARGTLLAHELAHYCRGDHWIRLLELLVTGVFWWHPVVWFARRQIEESEEECCDAWVVTELSHPPRRYAEALLDTIDFLCDMPKPLPPLASGLGPAAFLRRRLTRIMQGVSPKELSPYQRCAVALIAVLALPLQPFVLGSHSVSRLSQMIETPIQIAPALRSTVEIGPVENILAPSVASEEQMPAPPTESQAVSTPVRRSKRGERTWGSAVSSNGRFAVHITTAPRVLLANLATNEQTDLSIHGLTSVAFFPDGNSFVAGGSDGRVTIWSALTGTIVQTLYTHDDVIRSVAVSPQGTWVAIGSRDGSVQLVNVSANVSANQRVGELFRTEAAVNCVRFSPDGKRLAVAVGDWNSTEPGQVAIWNLQTVRADNILACDSAPGAVCFASNDELLVGQWSGQTSLWNLVKGQIVGLGMANKDSVTAASFSPDNPMLLPYVTAGRTNEVTSSETPAVSPEL